MLQQTQVRTVIPYYERWLSRFPTVQKLAAAPESAVLKQWEGLGYYSRARNLHRAAQMVVNDHQGRLPEDRELLLSLPGIGRYTAGAILSIAFGQCQPLVDGNVARVFARLFGVRENVKSPRGQARLWKLAAGLVPASAPGKFNESLMELGALVCTPQNPNCDQCPLRSGCAALRTKTVDRLPNLGKRPKSRRVLQRVLLIWRGEKLLLKQRPGRGALRGFWEFPSKPPAGVRCTVGRRLFTVQHGVMNDRFQIRACQCRWRSGEPTTAASGELWCWAGPSDWKRLLITGGHRKILKRLP